MPGIVTGIVANANIANELGKTLENYGDVSVVADRNPASYGPLKGVSALDIPQTLMSYGEDESTSNMYYEDIAEDYALVAVQVADNEIDTVKEIFANWDATDVQYFYKG